MIEDLIIALLLGNTEVIEISKYQHELRFMLSPDKQTLLQHYLDRHKIDNQLSMRLDDTTGEIHLESSITFEKIISEWTLNGIVALIAPQMLNANVFMLWVTLFGKPSRQGAQLRHNMSKQARETLCYLFEEMTGLSLVSNEICFIFKVIHPFIELSIQLKRPRYETHALYLLLSETDRNKFIQKDRRKTLTPCRTILSALF